MSAEEYMQGPASDDWDWDPCDWMPDAAAHGLSYTSTLQADFAELRETATRASARASSDKNMTELTPAKLVAAGYKVVSRAYREVARIDRPDWREHMAAAHAPWDPEGEGMRWANSPGMEDHYRRCYSKDTRTIPPAWINKIGSSSGSNIGYIQQGSDKPCSNYLYKFSDAHIVKRTKKALLITCEELDSATWVPKSIVISYAPLTLPGWFVQRLFDAGIKKETGDFEGLCPYCGGQHCDCGTDI